MASQRRSGREDVTGVRHVKLAVIILGLEPCNQSFVTGLVHIRDDQHVKFSDPKRLFEHRSRLCSRDAYLMVSSADPAAGNLLMGRKSGSDRLHDVFDMQLQGLEARMSAVFRMAVMLSTVQRLQSLRRRVE